MKLSSENAVVSDSNDTSDEFIDLPKVRESDIDGLNFEMAKQIMAKNLSQEPNRSYLEINRLLSESKKLQDDNDTLPLLQRQRVFLASHFATANWRSVNTAPAYMPTISYDEDKQSQVNVLLSIDLLKTDLRVIEDLRIVIIMQQIGDHWHYAWDNRQLLFVPAMSNVRKLPGRGIYPEANPIFCTSKEVQDLYNQHDEINRSDILTPVTALEFYLLTNDVVRLGSYLALANAQHSKSQCFERLCNTAISYYLLAALINSPNDSVNVLDVLAEYPNACCIIENIPVIDFIHRALSVGNRKYADILFKMMCDHYGDQVKLKTGYEAAQAVVAAPGLLSNSAQLAKTTAATAVTVATKLTGFFARVATTVHPIVSDTKASNTTAKPANSNDDNDDDDNNNNGVASNNSITTIAVPYQDHPAGPINLHHHANEDSSHPAILGSQFTRLFQPSTLDVFITGSANLVALRWIVDTLIMLIPNDVTAHTRFAMACSSHSAALGNVVSKQLNDSRVIRNKLVSHKKARELLNNLRDLINFSRVSYSEMRAILIEDAGLNAFVTQTYNWLIVKSDELLQKNAFLAQFDEAENYDALINELIEIRGQLQTYNKNLLIEIKVFLANKNQKNSHTLKELIAMHLPGFEKCEAGLTSLRKHVDCYEINKARSDKIYNAYQADLALLRGMISDNNHMTAENAFLAEALDNDYTTALNCMIALLRLVNNQHATMMYSLLLQRANLYGQSDQLPALQNGLGLLLPKHVALMRARQEELLISGLESEQQNFVKLMLLRLDGVPLSTQSSLPESGIRFGASPVKVDTTKTLKQDILMAVNFAKKSNVPGAKGLSKDEILFILNHNPARKAKLDHLLSKDSQFNTMLESALANTSSDNNAVDVLEGLRTCRI